MKKKGKFSNISNVSNKFKFATSFISPESKVKLLNVTLLILTRKILEQLCLGILYIVYYILFLKNFKILNHAVFTL